MAQAFQMVRSGLSDVMITGGSESMLCFGGVKAWEGLRVMSKDACRPFSANRNGMVQGEGQQFLFLKILIMQGNEEQRFWLKSLVMPCPLMLVIL